MPREVYDLVDHNVAVGDQPHSEVAALALFLYAMRGNAVFEKTFHGEIEVQPSEKGKIVRPRGGPEEDVQDAAGDDADPSDD